MKLVIQRAASASVTILREAGEDRTAAGSEMAGAGIISPLTDFGKPEAESGGRGMDGFGQEADKDKPEDTRSIGRGLAVLLGVGRGDTEQIADIYVDKLLKLRIFADENGKTNRSLMDVGGELLIVSQFTLYADCSHGNRPGFTNAGSPAEAEHLYQYFVSRCRERAVHVETGEFGADMRVSIVNDGPFTIVLDEDIALKKGAAKG